MNDKLKTILTEIKDSFQKLYADRLVDMMLYGSQARGDAVDGSDIDVLVVLKGEVNVMQEMDRVGDITYEIGYEHDVIISCMFVAERKYSIGEGPFIRNVRREGIRL